MSSGSYYDLGVEAVRERDAAAAAYMVGETEALASLLDVLEGPERAQQALADFARVQEPNFDATPRDLLAYDGFVRAACALWGQDPTPATALARRALAHAYGVAQSVAWLLDQGVAPPPDLDDDEEALAEKQADSYAKHVGTGPTLASRAPKLLSNARRLQLRCDETEGAAPRWALLGTSAGAERAAADYVAALEAAGTDAQRDAVATIVNREFYALCAATARCERYQRQKREAATDVAPVTLTTPTTAGPGPMLTTTTTTTTGPVLTTTTGPGPVEPVPLPAATTGPEQGPEPVSELGRQPVRDPAAVAARCWELATAFRRARVASLAAHLARASDAFAACEELGARPRRDLVSDVALVAALVASDAFTEADYYAPETAVGGAQDVLAIAARSGRHEAYKPVGAQARARDALADAEAGTPGLARAMYLALPLVRAAADRGTWESLRRVVYAGHGGRDAERAWAALDALDDETLGDAAACASQSDAWTALLVGVPSEGGGVESLPLGSAASAPAARPPTDPAASAAHRLRRLEYAFAASPTPRASAGREPLARDEDQEPGGDEEPGTYAHDVAQFQAQARDGLVIAMQGDFTDAAPPGVDPRRWDKAARERRKRREYVAGELAEKAQRRAARNARRAAKGLPPLPEDALDEMDTKGGDVAGGHGAQTQEELEARQWTLAEMEEALARAALSDDVSQAEPRFAPGVEVGTEGTGLDAPWHCAAAALLRSYAEGRFPVPSDAALFRVSGVGAAPAARAALGAEETVFTLEAERSPADAVLEYLAERVRARRARASADPRPAMRACKALLGEAAYTRANAAALLGAWLGRRGALSRPLVGVHGRNAFAPLSDAQSARVFLAVALLARPGVDVASEPGDAPLDPSSTAQHARECFRAREAATRLGLAGVDALAELQAAARLDAAAPGLALALRGLLGDAAPTDAVDALFGAPAASLTDFGADLSRAEGGAPDLLFSADGRAAELERAAAPFLAALMVGSVDDAGSALALREEPQ
jgi:hypothetical protein